MHSPAIRVRPTNPGGALSDYADQAGVSAHLAPTYGCLNTQSPNRVESTRPCTKVALSVACFRFCSLSSLVRDESILPLKREYKFNITYFIHKEFNWPLKTCRYQSTSLNSMRKQEDIKHCKVRSLCATC